MYVKKCHLNDLFYSFYADITHKQVLVSQIWYDITLQYGIFTEDSFISVESHYYITDVFYLIKKAVSLLGREMEIRFCTIIFYDIRSIKYEICVEKIVHRIIIFIH